MTTGFRQQVQAYFGDEPLTDAFVQWLEGRLPPEGLTAVNVPDLRLCFDALHGQSRALRTLNDRISLTAKHTLKGMKDPVLDADELSQLVHERVLVRRPHAAPRLESYSGRGALVQWLRAVTTMIALDKQRAARPAEDADAEDQALALASLEASPESKVRYRHDGEHLTRAVRDAVATLPAQERTALKLRFVDGLLPEEIGRLFGVHRTTVMRWLERAQESLQAEVRAQLAQRLKLHGRELESMISSLSRSVALHLSQVFKREQ